MEHQSVYNVPVPDMQPSVRRAVEEACALVLDQHSAAQTVNWVARVLEERILTTVCGFETLCVSEDGPPLRIFAAPEGECIMSLFMRTPDGHLLHLLPTPVCSNRTVFLDKVIERSFSPASTLGTGRLGVLRDDCQAGPVIDAIAIHARNRFDIWVLALCELGASVPIGTIGELVTAAVMPLLHACAMHDMEAVGRFLQNDPQAVALVEDFQKRLESQWSGIAGVRALLARRNVYQSIRTFPFLDRLFDLDDDVFLYNPQRHAAGLRRKGLGVTELRAVENILRDVESGKPLVSGISRALDSPRWVIRRLKGLPLTAISRYPGHPFRLIERWGELPPKLTFGPAAFEVLGALSECKSPEVAALDSAFRATCRRNDLAPLQWILEPKNYGQVMDYARFLHSAYRTLVARGILADGLDPVGLVGLPTLVEWLELQARWHQAEIACANIFILRERDNAIAVSQSYQEVRIKSDWHALIETAVMVSQFEFRAIDSCTALAEEGVAMEHCVSSYSDLCRDATTHILSVRLNMKRVATIEVRIEGKDDGRACYVLRQSCGFRNATPAPSVTSAIGEFVAGLNGGTIATSAAAVAASLFRGRQSATRHARCDASFSMLLAENPTLALELYSPCLEVSRNSGKLIGMIRQGLARLNPAEPVLEPLCDGRRG